MAGHYKEAVLAFSFATICGLLFGKTAIARLTVKLSAERTLAMVKEK
jgi:hypothetical protein